uniref:Uncharacterized protein n=1 Tax=Musca domestica TaxID=7370 RepID=A0A1I8NKH6_MUSDO
VTTQQPCTKILERQKKYMKMEQFFNNDQQTQNHVKFVEYILFMFCITHCLPFILMDYFQALLMECCPDSAIIPLSSLIGQATDGQNLIAGQFGGNNE